MVSEFSMRAQESETTCAEELQISESKIWEMGCVCSGGLG